MILQNYCINCDCSFDVTSSWKNKPENIFNKKIKNCPFCGLDLNCIPDAKGLDEK